ncbi:MAG: MFS transporter [Bryobacteraceae bacterium]
MNPKSLVLDRPADAREVSPKSTRVPLALFSIAHFFIDLYSSALGVFQPLLLERYGLNLAQAGILGGALAFSSSIMQPVYGYLSDRFRSRLFSVLAPAVAGIFISALGWAPGFWALIVMVILGGAGIASFHPQAASNATLGITRNPGRAMAIFISSGTLGLSLGPTYFSLFSSTFGLHGTAFAAVPGVLVTLLLLFALPPIAQPAMRTTGFDWRPLKAVWKPMTILYFLVVIRSIVQITFTQFLPLYLHLERGYSLRNASYTLSIYLLGGSMGGFVGGNLADRFGGRSVILISMIGSVPFLLIFLFSSGVASIVALFLSGLILLFTIPVNVLMGQQLAPSQTGTVSALMMGAAWGVAGLIFIPLVGVVADRLTLQWTLGGLVLFPLAGFVLALLLPKK